MCTQVHKADFLKIMSKPLDILLHFYHTRTIYDHGTFSYAHVRYLTMFYKVPNCFGDLMDICLEFFDI